ncbi:TPA: tail fiber domain-containing protein [Streptococcus pneumoniae]|nr:tail fiber domain-containing protein [Streptococcus pneumoniae]
MDALTRRQFDRAMFAKDRTLAIRVGDYASRDIKEASFEYGYIKGDTYKPGGTCAGSGKITFTSIITTFNKLDILHPEIGLLVGDTYQWVKMGEYFINDIEIDRNRNTTTLELMDGMFKLNREYVTDLHFPAEVREVIQEICLKTGIELANDYFGISAMRYHIEQVPEGKKLSFRDMLSAMTQMIGMSCFFNREGKMEIRDLTESNITINADSYFLHGLTKSEIEYQIAGITCKTDKKSLTVGMKTGRSLELDNVFMTQSALNDLYYKLKNLTYYPYNLNYQGHLLLEVGQWVTIQTNKKETFKVPVLSQSFTFKGGLRGRISADSKAGNDTQYSYEGTITKQIKQQDGIEAKIQAQIEAADAAFDAEFKKRKKEIDDGIELAKAKAEEVKQELSDTINQRFDSFDNGPLKEAKRRAEEALRNAGASTLLAQEAKRIGLDSVAKLEEFKRQATSAQTTLSGAIDALKQTIANDIRPKQAQAEVEIAKQVEALIQTKNELAGVKSAQATYEETTTRRLAELINLANGKASKSELTQTAEELASKIASVQVGGRNYIRGTRRMALASGLWTSGTFRPSGVGTAKTIDVSNSPATGFDKAIRLTSSNARGQIGIAQDRFEIMPGTYTISVWVKGSVGQRVKLQTYWEPDDETGISPYFILKDDKWTYLTFSNERKKAGTVSIGYVYLVNADAGEYLDVLAPQLEKGSLATSSKEAPEDTENQISAVESSFKQRADSLEVGVNRLTEGLRTKADISALNVTAENIRQSVKSLETDTQNKLNQKLSQAEFEVRAGSIRQEILNATKDKADKTLVVAEAGKLREEFSKMKVGSRNYAEDYDFSRGLWRYHQGDNSPRDWTISNGEYNVKGTTNTWKQMQIFSKEGSRVSEKDSTALLDLEIGETYTLSFQAMCHSGNPRVWVSLRANRTVPGNPEIISGTFTLTSSWQTYQVTIPALTKPEKFDFWRIILGYNEIGHVAFRKVELTRSSTRIDAGPAPEDGKTDLIAAKSTFERTAQGLRTDLSAIQEYVNKDGQRQEALQRYTREESAKQATAVRELVAKDYVGKATYQETVSAIENKFEAITNPQNGSIATQIATYKNAVDGRFAEITSLISGKASQSDFQRVKETSQLYERILGNTDNGIANNVARMALTSQLFQVEVSKASASGRNLFLNSLFKRDLRDKYSTYKLFDDASQTKGQLAVSIDSDNQFRGVNTLKIVSTFNGKIDNQKITFSLGGNSRTGRVDELKNKSARFSFWAKSTVNNTNFQARAGYRGTVKSVSLTTDWQFYDVEFIKNENTNATSELILHVFSNATVWIAFPKVEIGTASTPFSEAPEDTDEAIRTVQSQLAGSWAVQNINSAGDLISGLNLGANGHNRLSGKLTHITGETLIDRAVIKSAMVDKLKTANFEAGSVTTVVLDAEAVTAEKLKVDQALFNKLVANEAYLSQLFAKQAFINRVQSVAIDASQVRSGILSGDRIYGGTIRGTNIYGGTLTGHTQIQLGSYGSFDTVNGGLQINVPRDYNSKDGLGVQFIGSYGRGENIPYGLFLYRDSDFTIGNTATDTDEFLMTVQGYINAKGIGWLKTGKGSVNGKTTGTIGLWNSDNVSLSFGGSGNDIYYSYNSTAYSLWSVVNQHFSDRRLKENIVECKHKALDYIHQFQFKEYDWKKQEDRPQQAHTKIGLIAQEVQAVDPTLVYENGDTLNLDNLRLTNIALKAIQELALENQKLTHRLENLENERRTA